MKEVFMEWELGESHNAFETAGTPLGPEDFQPHASWKNFDPAAPSPLVKSS